MTEVKVGQLWADNDRREARDGKRQHLRVVALGWSQEHPQRPLAHLNNEDTGVATWVRVDRMRPNSTGYRLVEEAK